LFWYWFRILGGENEIKLKGSGRWLARRFHCMVVVFNLPGEPARFMTGVEVKYRGMQAEDANELRIFAALLGTPDEGGLEAIAEAADDYPWLRDGADELRGLSLEQWQGEHTRLFISGYPNTVCPPFESAYRHGQLHGPVRDEMEAFYARAGLEAEGDLADFLGTELECAAWLLEQESSESRELLDELLTEHLQRWVPRFAADLAAGAELRLYRSLGRRLLERIPAVAGT
jgi:TorA maturation chaperone TorD